MKKTSPPVAGTADNLRLDRQLCFPLYTASRLIMRLYQPLLEPLGLTYPQYVVLLILWEDAPCSVSHIGKRTLLNNRDFVLLAVGDDPIAGQQAVVIEHQMQLDDSLGAAELRPVEDRGAQLDGGGVDRQQLVLEAELVPDASLLGLTAGQIHHQVVEILEQCAGTMGIGIRPRWSV